MQYHHFLLCLRISNNESYEMSQDAPMYYEWGFLPVLEMLRMWHAILENSGVCCFYNVKRQEFPIQALYPCTGQQASCVWFKLLWIIYVARIPVDLRQNELCSPYFADLDHLGVKVSHFASNFKCNHKTRTNSIGPGFKVWPFSWMTLKRAPRHLPRPDPRKREDVFGGLSL